MSLGTSFAGSLSNHLSRAGIFAAAGALAWAMLGLGVWSRYGARAEWYASYGSSDAILAGVGVSTLACFFAVAALVDARRRRSPVALLLPLAIMLASVAWVGIRWLFPAPSLADAQAAFELGDEAKAGITLDALSVTGDAEASTPAALELRKQLDAQSSVEFEQLQRANAAAVDDQHLSQVSDGSLKVGTTMVLRRSWANPEKLETARRRLLGRARFMADEAWAGADARALARIAEETRGVDEDFTRQTEARALLAHGRGCADDACVQRVLAKLDTMPALAEPLAAVRVEIEGRHDEK